ncbi:hypothetical protein [Agrobacterium larrymoorei]|uniref:Uncharacterized protein n=1 Tax=Agrobacterium larrymoorei TaxID=160699 RepID=A0AAF0H9E6_9HYPH|nr:hypothetical protein [Agrobacterium larrymoorei]WHA40161.1 hypothetical protein CFBP5477_009970 [Agrobacterium larrymoorei]
MKTDFAKLVREIMNENGLSERGVCFAADVNRSTFRRWQEGGNIEIHRLERVLKVIGYELDIVRISAPTIHPKIVKEPVPAPQPELPKPTKPVKRLIGLACMELRY